MSSSHLFSLFCLYFAVLFHDAEPEWEWTNLLLPERTEWAAAIHCAPEMEAEMEVYDRRRGGIYTTVSGSLTEG